MTSYTTATLIERELRASEAFADTTVPSLSTVTDWIEEESAQIDNDAGTVFGSTQYDVTIDYNGDDYIHTKVSPIISVDTLLYNTAVLGSDEYSTGWVEKTENTDYSVYNNKGKIGILFRNFNPKEGEKKFRLIYTAGYSSTPAIVQKLATKMVAQRVLNTLIQSNVNSEDSGGSISVGSISIVEPADFGVKSYEALKNEINELRKSITTGFAVHRYDEY